MHVYYILGCIDVSFRGHTRLCMYKEQCTYKTSFKEVSPFGVAFYQVARQNILTSYEAVLKGIHEQYDTMVVSTF